MADALPQQTPVTPAPVAQAQPGASAAAPTAPVQATAVVAPAKPAPQIQTDEDERFFAAFGYFGPLFVIPLLVKPKSAFCKIHAKQSMVLFFVFIIFLIVLGFLSSFLGSLLFFPLFAVYVLAIYKAYKGEVWNIPYISKYAENVNVENLYGKAGLAVGALSGLKDKAEGFAQKAGQTVESLGKQESSQTPAASSAAPAAANQPSPPAVAGK